MLGVFVSSSGVRGIWLRHNLANLKNRLKNLEEKVAVEALVLTDWGTEYSGQAGGRLTKTSNCQINSRLLQSSLISLNLSA